MEFIFDIDNFCLRIGALRDEYNVGLLTTKGIDTPKKRHEILALHFLRHSYTHAMTNCDPKVLKDRRSLRNLANLIEGVEFQLQEAWGFSQDAAFHSYWFRVPHCTCPKLDNQENFGFPQRVINENCPVHGSEDA